MPKDLKQNGYDLRRPCADCPFRNDRHFYLPAERVRQIEEDTNVHPFTCHNTLDGGRQHCAGVLIMREKMQRPSLVMRLAQRVGVYDPTKLDMTAPVYEDWDEATEGCSMRRKDTARHTCAVDGKSNCRLCQQQRQIAPSEFANSEPHEPMWSGTDKEATVDERKNLRKKRAAKGHDSRRTNAAFKATRKESARDESNE